MQHIKQSDDILRNAILKIQNAEKILIVRLNN